MWIAIPASKQAHQYLKHKGFTHINRNEDIDKITEFILIQPDSKHYCYAGLIYSKIPIIQLNQMDQVLAMHKLLSHDSIAFENLIKELANAN